MYPCILKVMFIKDQDKDNFSLYKSHAVYRKITQSGYFIDKPQSFAQTCNPISFNR